MRNALFACASAALLAGCQAGEEAARREAFDGIPADDIVHFSGTEPFWNGNIEDGYASYATPANPEGTRFAVERFSGLNGAGYSGTLDGATFDLTITPGTCSDGMSDRSYPYTATLLIGDEMREGCAWTARQPFSGPATP
jgi:uncharacterized membrane protein